MNIHGFQKMTLLDFPGKVACTVFTAGCNLRCPFCHNAFLVTEIEQTDKFDEDEIISYIIKRGKVLDGVAITGGEPLLYPDTIDFIRRIKSLGLAVKLDTNGTFPDRLSEIIDAGVVDYIAMDIKNSPEKYALTTGIPELDIEPIKRSIELIRSSGIPHEFRTTVVAEYHEEADFEKIGQLIAGDEHYYLQNFVDSGNLISSEVHGVTPNEMRAFAEKAKQNIKYVEIRGL